VAIVGNTEDTKIKIMDDKNTPEFILDNFGYHQNEYFLIDEQEDKRFTEAFLKGVKRYL
jgi:hypothetical protein